MIIQVTDWEKLFTYYITQQNSSTWVNTRQSRLWAPAALWSWLGVFSMSVLSRLVMSNSL